MTAWFFVVSVLFGVLFAVAHLFLAHVDDQQFNEYWEKLENARQVEVCRKRCADLEKEVFLPIERVVADAEAAVTSKWISEHGE